MPGAGQLPAAVAAPAGVDGQAGQAQGLEVTAGGALGDLQLGRHLGGGDLPPGLKEQENRDETVGPHGEIFPEKLAT